MLVIHDYIPILALTTPATNFVYEDNFAANMNDYLEISGDYDEWGNRMAVNTDANGRFHTDWLNIGSKVKYDLIGKVAERTMLTRGTVVKILMGIQSHKFDMFKINPEDFIAKISTLIDEEKATGIVEGITYHKTDQTYDSDIFTMGYSKKSLKDSLKLKSMCWITWSLMAKAKTR
ncbi:MAG: hypothetical protein GX127_01285 [Eubacteriaceae bacterium]|nr:hypothetical protein [Eubacteriaceae bacterium]